MVVWDFSHQQYHSYFPCDPWIFQVTICSSSQCVWHFGHRLQKLRVFCHDFLRWFVEGRIKTMRQQNCWGLFFFRFFGESPTNFLKQKKAAQRHQQERVEFFISTYNLLESVTLKHHLDSTLASQADKVKSPRDPSTLWGESSRVCQQVVAFRRETSIVHNINVRSWEWCWMSGFFSNSSEGSSGPVVW